MYNDNTIQEYNEEENKIYWRYIIIYCRKSLQSSALPIKTVYSPFLYQFTYHSYSHVLLLPVPAYPF